ncbi:hypothetical protein AC579_9923 [Pseudocercospora musae]|uniref:Uncharacterized protein n=1 Tax=Pseudocercospora musae TaxID=113226 RepID=A0A139IFA4_9PEZI|nr:hypothetical protein AC579_9923 [Pseudocercospora musae]
MAYIKFLSAALLPAVVFGSSQYTITTKGCHGVSDGQANFWYTDDNQCMWGALWLTSPYVEGVKGHDITYNSICCVWDHGSGECFYNTHGSGSIHSKGDCRQDTAPCAVLKRAAGSSHSPTQGEQTTGAC